jgi:hypothetical protein
MQALHPLTGGDISKLHSHISRLTEAADHIVDDINALADELNRHRQTHVQLGILPAMSISPTSLREVSMEGKAALLRFSVCVGTLSHVISFLDQVESFALQQTER